MPTLPALANSLVRPPAVPSASHLANRLTVAAFLLFLTVPLVATLVRPAKPPTNEKRALYPPPYFPDARWKAQTFPVLFDGYFGDRIGFRRELLDLRRTTLVEGLKDSTSDQVWIGRDGWLFINCVGPLSLPALQPDAEPQVRQWADALEERRRWLAARGVRYVVLVAPEKSSVYPEHLPAWAQRHPPADHLASLTPRVPVLELVDPLPAILRAKAAGSVYHRTDSHWNDAGAFAAYQELGRAVRRQWPAYRGKRLADFSPRPRTADGCDLALSLGRPPEQCGEDCTLLVEPEGTTTYAPADQLAARLERHPDRLKHLSPIVAESRGGTGRAVLLHDSFGTTFQRHLASDFRRLTSVGTYGFPTDVIEDERPDVVIQLMVARTLTFVRPMRLATMTP